MDIQGKKAIVTGGDRGIGRAIAVALAKKGADVAVNFYTNETAAETTLELISGFGRNAIKIQADLRDFNQIEDMVSEVRKKFGAIDILVNNAGISGSNTTLEKIPIEEWRNVIELNLTGMFLCCKTAAKELKKAHGKIVNISSIAGKMGGTIGCHYAASKAGVIGLTFALAGELAPLVTVNAIAPGPVDTDFISPAKKKDLAMKTPFGRIATPDEIAHTVIYLLENDYVSGEVIDVNAGRYVD
ncbi:MAG: 3-oxoacyl-ACP reductase FabG [Candidatus Aminicenantes bacterium]|nr:3-oxoacyl-ACP reductase FabG [Candidatus Aminicenantes bacterium]